MDAAITTQKLQDQRLQNELVNIARKNELPIPSTPVYFFTNIMTTTFANDAAAAAGGVPVGYVYRNGSVLQVRVV
jgi:hypothetical protein